MLIEIYGTGCARCAQVESIMREAAASTGGEIEVVKVTDFAATMKAGVLTTPAVRIDGHIVAKGRVPTKEEALEWIRQAATND